MKDGQTLFHRTLPAPTSGPKTEDVYKDIANDVEKSFNTSEYAFAFEDYKIHLYNNEIVLKSLQRFVSKAHKVFTEKFNEIAFSFNYDKRLQSFNGVKSYHIVTPPLPLPLFIGGWNFWKTIEVEECMMMYGFCTDNAIYSARF